MKLTIVQNPMVGGVTLAERYEFIGRPAEEDPPGRKMNYATPYSVGLVQEVVVLDRSREFRVLSRNSQLAAQSLADICQRELHLPLFAATHTRASLSGQIAIYGGWKRWENLQEVDNGVKEDALWRASPAEYGNWC